MSNGEIDEPRGLTIAKLEAAMKILEAGEPSTIYITAARAAELEAMGMGEYLAEGVVVAPPSKRN